MIRIYHVTGRFTKDYPPFSGYTGFALRGTLGLSLKRIFCTQNLKSCYDCPSTLTCFYSYFYETRSIVKPNARIATKSGRKGITKPYTLTPLKINGREINFTLTIFGIKSIMHEPYIIMAIIGAGREGLGFLGGSERRNFQITRIKVEDPINKISWIAYDTSSGYQTRFAFQTEKENLISKLNSEAQKIIDLKPTKLIIRFTTPTKIRRKNKALLKPKLSDIIANLARKYSLIAEYHEIGEPLTAQQAKQLIQGVEEHTKIMSCAINKLKLKKFSIEENTEKQLGTFIKGYITYQINPKLWYQPWAKLMTTLLILSKYTGIGVFTTAGCGQTETYWKIP